MKKINPLIAIGFLIATVFWIGVLGWQASYAPTEIEKQKCYDAAHKSGHKTEDCKTLWERTTTDPVAIFTLVLAISTVGLWGATIFLYRAGEKQIVVARDAANAAIRQARVAESALFAVEIPYLYVVIKSHAISVEHYAIKKIGTMNADGIGLDESDFSNVITFCFHNTGRTPAEIIEFDAVIRFEEWPPKPIIPAAKPSRWATEIVPAHCQSKERGRPFGSDLLLGGGMNREKEALWFKGYVRYADVFKNEYIYGFCFGFDTFAKEGTTGEFYTNGGDDHNYRKQEKSSRQLTEPPDAI